MQNQIKQTYRIRLWGGMSSTLIAVALLAAVHPTAGQAIYSTGFEPESFLEDTALAGQDGWIAPPPLSPNAAVVTADKPRQGKQTVHVLGGDLIHAVEPGLTLTQRRGERGGTQRGGAATKVGQPFQPVGPPGPMSGE